MSLNLYLDECADSKPLAELLVHAGHVVTRPRQIQANGWPDARVLEYTTENQMVLITKNPPDFQALAESQEHGGILLVYNENNVRTDMSDLDIVRAIKNLEAAMKLGGDPIVGNIHNLNEWRY